MSEQQSKIEISSPDASEAEAAAIIAALRRFLDDHSAVDSPLQPVQPAWLTAALNEGVQRQPQMPASWAASRV